MNIVHRLLATMVIIFYHTSSSTCEFCQMVKSHIFYEKSNLQWNYSDKMFNFDRYISNPYSNINNLIVQFSCMHSFITFLNACASYVQIWNWFAISRYQLTDSLSSSRARSGQIVCMHTQNIYIFPFCLNKHCQPIQWHNRIAAARMCRFNKTQKPVECLVYQLRCLARDTHIFCWTNSKHSHHFVSRSIFFLLNFHSIKCKYTRTTTTIRQIIKLSHRLIKSISTVLVSVDVCLRSEFEFKIRNE